MTAMATMNGHTAMATQRADLSIRFTADERRVILDTCCGGASESEAHALIAIAEARGLNPILGECYFVKRYDTQTRRDRWAVQSAIDSFRIKAEQTGLYAGQDEPEYEYDAKGNVTLARVRVWRKDWTRPSVGVARWGEYVQTTREGNPTRFWAQMPHNQLAKCAEALALRKAFPAVLSKIYVTEEMGQADNVVPYRHPEEPPRIDVKPAASLPAADGTFSKLCARLDAAEDVALINGIASACGKAHRAGQITDGQLESLKSAVTKKRALVAGRQVPPMPPSEPDPADMPLGDDGSSSDLEGGGR